MVDGPGVGIEPRTPQKRSQGVCSGAILVLGFMNNRLEVGNPTLIVLGKERLLIGKFAPSDGTKKEKGPHGPLL